MPDLARRTHGYAGADLAALCREAAMSALRRLLPEIGFGEYEHSRWTKLEALKVERGRFRRLPRSNPAFGPAGNLSRGPRDALGRCRRARRYRRRALTEAVLWPLHHSETFAAAGVRPPRGMVLHGGPGLGQDFAGQARGGRKRGQLHFAIKGPQLISMWAGESERAVREVFRKARLGGPAIIFFDEIDALAPERGGGASSQVSERIVAQLLTELDGIEDLKGVFVLAATNRIDRVDPALLRPGRFDAVVELKPPCREARLAILKVHTKRMPLAACEETLAAIAEESEGFSGAEMEAICREAAYAAIRRAVAHTSNGKAGSAAFQPGPLEVTPADLRQAITRVGETR